MPQHLAEWVSQHVLPYRDKDCAWLSAYHFFRDPPRGAISDTSFFLSPADGIVLYAGAYDPDQPIDLKGSSYSVRDALADKTFDKPAIVIGIFMTFYDVHVNRVPFPGRLSYRDVDPVYSYNRPMLDVEHALLDKLRVPQTSDYLKVNERVVNTIQNPLLLAYPYHIVQIADYDVDCILPFERSQNQPVSQGQRFSHRAYLL
jgi:phosphatidylserine decarboxylase